MYSPALANWKPARALVSFRRLYNSAAFAVRESTPVSEIIINLLSSFTIFFFRCSPYRQMSPQQFFSTEVESAVRAWEASFARSHGSRKPTAIDIQTAGFTVVQLYKAYYEERKRKKSKLINATAASINSTCPTASTSNIHEINRFIIPSWSNESKILPLDKVVSTQAQRESPEFPEFQNQNHHQANENMYQQQESEWTENQEHKEIIRNIHWRQESEETEEQQESEEIEEQQESEETKEQQESKETENLSSNQSQSSSTLEIHERWQRQQQKQSSTSSGDDNCNQVQLSRCNTFTWEAWYPQNQDAVHDLQIESQKFCAIDDSNHQNLHLDYTSGQRFPKRRKKLARPRDALPGFKKGRGFAKNYTILKKTKSKSAGSRPAAEVGVFNQPIRSRNYLDRGMKKEDYFVEIVDRMTEDLVPFPQRDADADQHQQNTDLTLDHAPLCPGHASPCVLYKVKKKGGNFGKEFFKCSNKFKPCDFFQWYTDWIDSSIHMNTFHNLSQQDVDHIIAKPLLERYNSLESALHALTQYSHFQTVQSQVIERIISSHSTLAVLPTGGGKSLIFQMAAALLPGTALVVTPLVSLIKDQLHYIPDTIPAAALHSAMNATETKDVYDKFRAGRLKVLIVSPERFESHRFINEITRVKGCISFICIDEAHCISQWSCNFRPIYLRLKTIMDRYLQEPCPFLALSATVTASVKKQLCKVLGIGTQNVFISESKRENLQLSASRDSNKNAALRKMLIEEPLCKGPVIVYVSTQRECAEVSNYLKTYNIRSVIYHGGLSTEIRDKNQELFNSNKVRILVATVAFGMGLNKADIRGVIHYHMPRSFEAYIQEIGRAGRDHQPAICHTFYGKIDCSWVKAQIHRDGIDRSQVMESLEIIFGKRDGEPVPWYTGTQGVECVGLDDFRAMRKVNKEMIETMLTWLEQGGYIEYEGYEPAFAEIKIYVKDLDSRVKQDQYLEYLKYEHGDKIARDHTFELDFMKAARRTQSSVEQVVQWINKLVAKRICRTTFIKERFLFRRCTTADQKLDMIHVCTIIFHNFQNMEKNLHDNVCQLSEMFESYSFNSFEDGLKNKSTYLQCSDDMHQCIECYMRQDIDEAKEHQTSDGKAKTEQDWRCMLPPDEEGFRRKEMLLQKDILVLLKLDEDHNLLRSGRDIVEILQGCSDLSRAVCFSGFGTKLKREYENWDFYQLLEVCNKVYRNHRKEAQ